MKQLSKLPAAVRYLGHACVPVVLCALSLTFQLAASASAIAQEPQLDASARKFRSDVAGHVVLADATFHPTLVVAEAVRCGFEVETNIRLKGNTRSITREEVDRVVRDIVARSFPKRDHLAMAAKPSPFVLRIDWETIANREGLVMQTICRTSLVQRDVGVLGMAKVRYAEAEIYNLPRLHAFSTAYNPTGPGEHLAPVFQELAKDLEAAACKVGAKPLPAERLFGFEIEATDDKSDAAVVDAPPEQVIESPGVWKLARERGVLVAVEKFCDDPETSAWLAKQGVTEVGLAKHFERELQAMQVPVSIDPTRLPKRAACGQMPFTLDVCIQISPLRLPRHAGGGLYCGLSGTVRLSDPFVVAPHLDKTLLVAAGLGETRLVQMFHALGRRHSAASLFGEMRDECVKKVRRLLAE